MRAVRLAASSLLATCLVVAGVSAAAIAAGVTVFGLRTAGAIALYFIVWWTLLFAVLPLGVRSQAEEGSIVAGSEPGAPVMPMLREKAILTTLAAGLVFVSAAGFLPLAGL